MKHVAVPFTSRRGSTQEVLDEIAQKINAYLESQPGSRVVQATPEVVYLDSPGGFTQYSISGYCLLIAEVPEEQGLTESTESTPSGA